MPKLFAGNCSGFCLLDDIGQGSYGKLNHISMVVIQIAGGVDIILDIIIKDRPICVLLGNLIGILEMVSFMGAWSDMFLSRLVT